MTTIKIITLGVVSTLLLLTNGIPAFGQDKTVQIGMAKSFFIDKTASVAEIAADDFKIVLKKSTGLDGKLDTKLTAFELAAKLDSKQMDFALLFAHEAGWVQKKYPDIEPLLIAVSRGNVERAYLVVHKSNPAKSVADLAGKKLDMPVGTIGPSRLFLDRLITATAQKTPAQYFGAIIRSTAPAAALDEVARGKTDAVLVEASSLDFYKGVKGPVFEKNLRVLLESVVFPAATIVYKKGGVDDATLKRLRDGLLKAHTLPEGRDLMKTWKIDALELATSDYTKSVAELLKTYPAP